MCVCVCVCVCGFNLWFAAIVALINNGKRITSCGLGVWELRSKHLSDPPSLTNPLVVGSSSVCVYPPF